MERRLPPMNEAVKPKLDKQDKLNILRHYCEQCVSWGFDITHLFGVPLSNFNYDNLIDETFRIAKDHGNDEFANDYKELLDLKGRS
jgi:hypothetical protein